MIKRYFFIKKQQNLSSSKEDIKFNEGCTGNFVLIYGIDQTVTKTSTIIRTNNTSNVHIMSLLLSIGLNLLLKLPFNLQSILTLKMVEAIRRVNKSYLMLKTKFKDQKNMF